MAEAEMNAPQADTGDPRFTVGLLSDVISLLERHGYICPSEQSARRAAHADTLVNLLHMVREFEGQRRSSVQPGEEHVV